MNNYDKHNSPYEKLLEAINSSVNSSNSLTGSSSNLKSCSTSSDSTNTITWNSSSGLAYGLASANSSSWNNIVSTVSDYSEYLGSLAKTEYTDKDYVSETLSVLNGKKDISHLYEIISKRRELINDIEKIKFSPVYFQEYSSNHVSKICVITNEILKLFPEIFNREKVMYLNNFSESEISSIFKESSEIKNEHYILLLHPEFPESLLPSLTAGMSIKEARVIYTIFLMSRNILTGTLLKKYHSYLLYSTRTSKAFSTKIVNALKQLPDSSFFDSFLINSKILNNIPTGQLSTLSLSSSVINAYGDMPDSKFVYTELISKSNYKMSEKIFLNSNFFNLFLRDQGNAGYTLQSYNQLSTKFSINQMKEFIHKIGEYAVNNNMYFKVDIFSFINGVTLQQGGSSLVNRYPYPEDDLLVLIEKTNEKIRDIKEIKKIIGESEKYTGIRLYLELQ